MDIRRALARAGWRVHPWGLGLNLGAKRDTLDRLGQRLDEIYDGRPVLLVGWSLGGMFARELAHRHPHKVRAVAYPTAERGGSRGGAATSWPWASRGPSAI